MKRSNNYGILKTVSLTDASDMLSSKGEEARRERMDELNTKAGYPESQDVEEIRNTKVLEIDSLDEDGTNPHPKFPGQVNESGEEVGTYIDDEGKDVTKAFMKYLMKDAMKSNKYWKKPAKNKAAKTPSKSERFDVRSKGQAATEKYHTPSERHNKRMDAINRGWATNKEKADKESAAKFDEDFPDMANLLDSLKNTPTPEKMMKAERPNRYGTAKVDHSVRQQDEITGATGDALARHGLGSKGKTWEQQGQNYEDKLSSQLEDPVAHYTANDTRQKSMEKASHDKDDKLVWTSVGRDDSPIKPRKRGADYGTLFRGRGDDQPELTPSEKQTRREMSSRSTSMKAVEKASHDNDRQLGFEGMDPDNMGSPSTWEDALANSKHITPRVNAKDPNALQNFHQLARDGKREMPTDPAYFSVLREEVEAGVDHASKNKHVITPQMFEISDRMEPDFSTRRTLSNEKYDKKYEDKPHHDKLGRDAIRQMYPDHFDYESKSLQNSILKAYDKYLMKAKKYKNIKDKIKSKDPKHWQQAYEQLKPRQDAFFETSPKAKHVAAMDAHKAEHGQFPWDAETES